MAPPVQSLFITLKRSFAGTREHHVRILQSLGFRYRQQTVEKPNVAHIRGAIDKVRPCGEFSVGPERGSAPGRTQPAAAAGLQLQRRSCRRSCHSFSRHLLASLHLLSVQRYPAGAAHGAGGDGRAAGSAASSRGGSQSTAATHCGAALRNRGGSCCVPRCYSTQLRQGMATH